MGPPSAARNPHPYVAGVVSLALVALALVAWQVPRPPADLRTFGAFALIAIAYHGFGRVAVVLRWRRQRIDVTFVEAVVVVAAAFAQPFLLAPAVLVALVASSVASRKKPVKAAFNVAQGTLAAAGATLASLAAMALGASAIGAAAVAVLTYGLVNDATIAGLFAWMERASPTRVYRERLVVAGAFSLVIGGSLGFAFVGLWLLHPVASLLAIPLATSAVAYGRLHGRAERELALHRRLSGDAHALLGVADDDRVVELVLASANEALEASAVQLRAGDRMQEAGYDVASRGSSIVAPLVGPSGRELGALEAWSRRGHPAFTSSDRALLDLLASWAAHALESAAALRELHAQREALARQERMTTLGTLVAGVAHEINNPLTYVAGNLELVREDLDARIAAPDDATPLDVDELRRAVCAASRGAEQIAHVVRSLRAVARERADGAMEIADLNRLTEDIATLLQGALPAGVELSWKGASAAPLVLGQPAELHQAVLNLAKNAAEAVAPRGGHVRLEVHHDASAARIVVSDDGPGIPPDVASRLFTPFFTTKGPSGTGLGLSIVASIARAHHGEVVAESPPGGGARFTLRLPLARATA